MTVQKYSIVDRPSWLTRRLGNLNASEIGALAGVDPFRTPFDIYCEKTGRFSSTTENAAMKRGRLSEGTALEYLAEDYPEWRVVRPGVYLWDPDLRLGCTPDALTEDDDGGLVNLQIKTVSRPAFEKWDGTPPLGYRLQVITESMLLGAKTGYLVVLVINTYGNELELFEVPRHPAAEARIKQLALEFWDNIAKGRMPAPDYSRDEATIKAIYARADAGKVVDLTGDNLLPSILRDREHLKAYVADAEKRLKVIETEIRDKIGDAERAILPGWSITAKDEFHKAHVVAEHTRRPLKIKNLQDKEQAA